LYDFQENTDQNDGCGKIVKNSGKKKREQHKYKCQYFFISGFDAVYDDVKSIMGIDQLYDCHRSNQKE